MTSFMKLTIVSVKTLFCCCYLNLCEILDSHQQVLRYLLTEIEILLLCISLSLMSPRHLVKGHNTNDWELFAFLPYPGDFNTRKHLLNTTEVR